MSIFFSENHKKLKPYTPGEQPRERKYIKLNTNESPYPPSPSVIEAAKAEAGRLNLYSDPTLADLTKTASEHYGLPEEYFLFTNGSDEILNFAFCAYGDSDHPFVFPDLTYGFYPVFADYNRVPYEIIPLEDDFSIDEEKYVNIEKNIVIANPNAPTGLYLELEKIEKIISTNPNNIVIIDEAYIDFGGESAINLVKKYKNLIVTRTFSKSFSLAGARLGFGAADPELIRDLNTIKYSTNPYNVNRMTSATGVAALRDADYYTSNARSVANTREWVKQELKNRGFCVTDSRANFIFASHPTISGEDFYLKLRENGILVRYFKGVERIKNYNRITIGSRDEMEEFVKIADLILKNQK